MLKAWHDLREVFEVEDGSLPGLCEILFEDDEAVSMAFEYLRSISKPISSEFILYNLRLETDVPLISTKNPAKLVATGETEPFNVMLYGALSAEKSDFPELGVFVYPKELQFYFYSGPHWSQDSLRRLFEIMATIAKEYEAKAIRSLLHDTQYFSDFWTLFEKHYKQVLASI